jgi:hypothetical protein
LAGIFIWMPTPPGWVRKWQFGLVPNEYWPLLALAVVGAGILVFMFASAFLLLCLQRLYETFGNWRRRPPIQPLGLSDGVLRQPRKPRNDVVN